MAKLGFPTFVLIGHDRGGRVSYRSALDHPKAVERLAVFDVIPILEAWNRTDPRFAKTYWPWILLSQKEPLPERYLVGALQAVFNNPFGQGSFGGEILEEYVSTYRDPARVHGICEEYRAVATTGVEHHRADKEALKQIECPTILLWAEGGPLDTFYAKDGGLLGMWRQWVPRAQGQALKEGHFFPEENPGDTAGLVKQFFLGKSSIGVFLPITKRVSTRLLKSRWYGNETVDKSSHSYCSSGGGHWLVCISAGAACG